MFGGDWRWLFLLGKWFEERVGGGWKRGGEGRGEDVVGKNFQKKSGVPKNPVEKGAIIQEMS